MNTLVLVIGVFLLLAGIFCGVYVQSEEQFFGLVTTNEKPYDQYMIPLLIGGVVLVLVGAFLPPMKEKK